MKPYSDTSTLLTRDASWAVGYRPIIERVAAARGIPISVIVGMGSRESNWGASLRPKGPAGTGDHGHGRGLMQIDDRSHEFARSGKWRDPSCNIDYGVAFLAQLRHTIHKEQPAITADQALRLALAAYNCGLGNLHKALRHDLDPDHYTAGRDYGADVLARAAWFRAHGWPDTPTTNGDTQ